jgi:hypothetical protein
LHKKNVGRSSYPHQWFIDLQSAARKKYLETGNVWDDQLTEFKRRISKMKFVNPSVLEEVFIQYKDESWQLWQAEFKKFSTGRWQNININEIPARKKIYKEVMKNQAKKIGFTLDKELSTSSKPIFTKPFLETWRLCFVIDSVLINRPVEESYSAKNSRIVVKPGPDFIISFGLINNKNRGGLFSKRGQILIFEFNDFYPIRLPTIPSTVYSGFYSVDELEALINIYLILYESIADEFEKALWNGFIALRPYGG